MARASVPAVQTWTKRFRCSLLERTRPGPDTRVAPFQRTPSSCSSLTLVARPKSVTSIWDLRRAVSMEVSTSLSPRYTRSIPATGIVASPLITAPLFSTRSSTSQSEGRWTSPRVSRGATARLAPLCVSVGIGGLGIDMLALIERISQLFQPGNTSDFAAAIDHANVAAKILPELPTDERFPPVYC